MRRGSQSRPSHVSLGVGSPPNAHSLMPRSDRQISAALLIAAASSYVFYVVHSLAVQGFVADLWRLARKFMIHK